VIRHPTIKAIIDQCVGNVDSSSEDLVQMSTQLVGDGVRVECTGEIEEVEFAIEVGMWLLKSPLTTIAAFASYLRMSLMMSVTLTALSFWNCCSPGSR
jgi:hypothetical protein